jgi:hypothetical protein
MLLAMRQLKPNLEEPNSTDDGEGLSLVIGSDQGNAQTAQKMILPAVDP